MFKPAWEIVSRTAQALGVMWEIHQPEVWVFGHWHKNREIRVENTRFVCMGEDCLRDMHYPTCDHFEETKK